MNVPFQTQTSSKKKKVSQTCLKKLGTVMVAGRNVSRLELKSSEDQLRLFSRLLRRSREPLRVNEPISDARLRN